MKKNLLTRVLIFSVMLALVGCATVQRQSEPEQQTDDAKGGVAPITMTIADRTYELVTFYRGNGIGSPTICALVKNARATGAGLGEEDAQYLLDHQEDIPGTARDKEFFFADWRNPNDPDFVGYIHWCLNHWDRSWGYVGSAWRDSYWVLRRKQ